MKFYNGKPLLKLLEDIDYVKNINNEDFILGIKYVARPNSNFRGYKGKISSGKISVGENIRIFGKQQSSKITEILVNNKQVKQANAGDVVCISLNDEIDISAGDYLTSFSSNLAFSNKFNANLIWLDHEDLSHDKEYIIKFYNNKTETINISPKFNYNINSLAEEKYEVFKLNQIGNFDIEIAGKMALTNYKKNKELGSFILIDKISNFTVAAGMVNQTNISKAQIPVSKNIFPTDIDIKNIDRAKLKNQKPACIWLTGLSGSGKSTIANLLDQSLYKMQKHSFVLDGDNMRSGLNADLGFSREDRHENIRRIGYICKLMHDAGLIVISSFISPDATIRKYIKNNIFNDNGFIEVYLNTDIETCKKRDPKNLYKKAAEGKIEEFTGIDAPYDIPSNPDIVIDTVKYSPEECVMQILKLII